MEQRTQRLLFWLVSLGTIAFIVFAVARGTTNAAPSTAPRVATATVTLTMTPALNNAYTGFATDGTFAPASSFVPAQSLNSVVQVSSSGNYVLALNSNGTLFSWKDETMWVQPGADIPTALTLPGANVTQISANLYSLARKSDGTVVGWGCPADKPEGCTPPVGLSDVAKVVSGGYANVSAAIKTDGSLVLWGPKALTLTSAQASNVRDVFIWDDYTAHHGIVILHTDGTVESNISQATGCQSTMGTECPIINYPSITGISSLVPGPDVGIVAMLKSNGTVMAFFLGNVVQVLPATFQNVVQAYSTNFALVALRSDGSVVYYDTSNPPLGVITPKCQPPAVQFVGVTTSGFFTIGRNTTLCPTATPTRTVPPTRTTAPRFTMTPVASATSTQTATRIASATSVPVATATATRTANAKVGKPSATKVMSKTPTKSPTKSRTPTKPGKPTKTPTKKK